MPTTVRCAEQELQESKAFAAGAMQRPGRASALQQPQVLQTTNRNDEVH